MNRGVDEEKEKDIKERERERKINREHKPI